MSNAMTVPIPTPEPAAPAPLQLLGDLDADARIGEFCELPAHGEQAVVNRRIDSDLI